MNAISWAKAGAHQRSRPQQKHERHTPVAHHTPISIPNRSASGLRGVDLLEQVTQSTVIQRRRWTELYRRLWERKTKLDIADTILFVNGNPADWYFTSASTGEVKKKSSSKLNSAAIRKQCAKATLSNDQSRPQRLRARLVHEESGQLVNTLLRDGEISFVLSQPPSDLAVTSVLLQPLLLPSRQPASARGTFVAKYNIATTSSCTRVLHLENGELYGLLPSQSTASSNATEGTRRPRSAPATTQSLQLEEIVKTELRKLVHEVEAAFRDRVRLLTADFQVTDMHRLVLVRVSGIVFFSDLVQKKDVPSPVLRSNICDAQQNRKTRRRTSSIAVEEISKCVGRAFCHCIEAISAPSLSRFRPSRKQTEVCQITRKSISFSENESAFLKRFGADTEATLRTVEISDLTATSSWARRGKSSDGLAKLLERRIFMLQNTLWNPKSDAFDPKACVMDPVEFETAQWLPHEYAMVTVCRACYLIYQAIDDERFNRSRETATAAARRSTELFRSKFLESEQVAIGTIRPSKVNRQIRGAWELNEDDEM